MVPASDRTKMNFGSGGQSSPKVWRDIWGSGQGIGAVKRVEPVATFVDRLAREYTDANQRLVSRFRSSYPL
jgi:nitronate monooxygenase